MAEEEDRRSDGFQRMQVAPDMKEDPSHNETAQQQHRIGHSLPSAFSLQPSAASLATSQVESSLDWIEESCVGWNKSK